MRTLNLGILAHVDAGKTSLTERLLYTAGVIDEIGSVDAGNTQTDTMALERRRGITIKTAVASFVVDRPGPGPGRAITINLIDTPGHPDFIAEVERVLSVLDGAVLVVSAVEGVQAQTLVLMRALDRLRIPTLVFVNKIDREGARPDEVVRGIRARLTPATLTMGTAIGPGSKTAVVRSFGPQDADFTTRLTNLLADHDEGFVADFVADESIASYSAMRKKLATQVQQTAVHPVYTGSAVTGAGTAELVAGVAELLLPAEQNPQGPPAGTVFKVERTRSGEKVGYLRMFSGTLRIRDRLQLNGNDRATVTAIEVIDAGANDRHTAISAGQIGRVHGLGDIRIGDRLGDRQDRQQRTSMTAQHFSPPTLESVVTPRRAEDWAALYVALSQLAEQDPLINLRQDDLRRELSVTLYGEVQKEVIGETLATDFGVDVTFTETTTICIERIHGTGEAVEIIGVGDNPFLATVGLRLASAPIGAGISFGLGIELGSLPLSFISAIDETVKLTLQQGLCGWDVPDATVTLIRSGYWPRQSHAHATFDKSMSSTAGDFRNVTPLVLMAALRSAGTAICEPMHHFRLELPTDRLGGVLPVVSRLRGLPTTSATGTSSTVLDGDIPAAQVHALQQMLPSLTRGEGLLETAFDHYRPVSGTPPRRSRTDVNPLNRKEYLLRVQRRG